MIITSANTLIPCLRVSPKQCQTESFKGSCQLLLLYVHITYYPTIRMYFGEVCTSKVKVTAPLPKREGSYSEYAGKIVILTSHSVESYCLSGACSWLTDQVLLFQVTSPAKFWPCWTFSIGIALIVWIARPPSTFSTTTFLLSSRARKEMR